MACSSDTVNQQAAQLNNPDNHSDLTLAADFSDTNNISTTIYDFFDVSVRTHKGSPLSTPATFGRRAKVNTVRMLGGWRGKNLATDTYQWNGEKFVYNFDAATKRINGWLSHDWDIFQIVLDNPPWAFQKGLTFVDEPDGKHFLKKDAEGVYGNVLPPADPQAWHNYIKSFIQHLVATYGKEQVLTWRFRVGSEIDTRPQHWSATREEFFDHYQNTVTALHAVLPEVKVGAHFREGSFKGRYVDYTGNTEDSYAPHFLTWAKKHNIAYDFLAISYYPHITKPHELDMSAVYNHDIAPIIEHPDWDENASFEIHEFKFISKMQKAGFISVATSHASAFFAMFSKMMLEKNIKEVFQWGNLSKGHYIPEALTQLALHSMVGNQLFNNTVQGSSAIEGNKINGIFSKQPNKDNYDLLLFNFNSQQLDLQKPEDFTLQLTVNNPKDSKFEYRLASIDSSNNIEQQFFADFEKANLPIEQGGWRKPNVHPTASINKALSDEGVAVFKQYSHKYPKNNQLFWGKWHTIKTIASSDHEATKSLINLSGQIPSFAVQRYEVRRVEN